MTKKKSKVTEVAPALSWAHRDGNENEGLPWGPHKLPLSIDLEDVSIVVEEQGHGYSYRREGLGESIEKTILVDKGSFYISPVEPLHKPAGISTHLLIELEQPLLVEPKATRSAYLTFPLELAAVVEKHRGGEHLLDIISFCNSKYTLYGGVRSGLLCRYWKSALYNSLPSLNPLKEGIMKIELQNTMSSWGEVKKLVFSAYGMKIYYGPDLVSLKASLKINNEITAETSFDDQPVKPGMRKALEQYSSRLISLAGRTVMEEGY